MPAIIADRSIVTQINVFTTTPENQDALIALLTQAASAVSGVPGWMSASLHRSLDGTRVVNYAQCDSMASWEAVMMRLRAGGWLERSQHLGTAHPGLYEVVHTVEA